MTATRAPRRNSYQLLLEDNLPFITRIAAQWNSIIDQGRKPTVQERLEMADKLRMNDARFYDFRKHCPAGMFRSLGETALSPQNGQAAENTLSPETAGHEKDR